MKGVRCTLGSGWLLTARPQPRLDTDSHKYECPWCGRLIAANTNLQLAAHCLARHNKPTKAKPS